MTNNFLDAAKRRRSVYALGKQLPVSNDVIKGIVEDAVLHTPSAFNSQNGRVIVLFGKESDKLWAMSKEELFKVVPADGQAATGAKIDGFAAGAGTILFFEDSRPVEELKSNFPLYAHNFDGWSVQSIGMLQYVIWTAFAEKKIGASLQHYNELIEKRVKETWGVPDSWKLVSQMPFGAKLADDGDKEFLPVDSRMKVFGK